MRIVLIRVLIGLTLMALICSGCTTKEQVGKAKKEPPQSIHTQTPKKDGTVISMKK